MLTRLQATVRSRSLNHALADGVDPTDSPALAHRARCMCSAENRAKIADGIRSALRAVDGPPRAMGSWMTPDRLEVVFARPVMERLHELLVSDRPVYVQGLAKLDLLVTDMASPLYSPSYRGQLSEQLEHLALILDGQEERR